MDCKSAQYIFMKLLDGNCECANNVELHEHIATCKNCRDDFELYKTMVDCFNDSEPINIPCEFEQFERIVMERIYSINPHFSARSYMLKNSLTLLLFRHIAFFVMIIGFTMYMIYKAYRFLIVSLSPTRKLSKMKRSGIYILDFCKAKINKKDIKNTIALLSIIISLSTIMEIVKNLRKQG